MHADEVKVDERAQPQPKHTIDCGVAGRECGNTRTPSVSSVLVLSEQLKGTFLLRLLFFTDLSYS